MGDPLQTRGGRGGDGALANQHAGKDGGSLMSHSGKVDGTAACAACGFANPAGFKFCGSCGANLAASRPRPSRQVAAERRQITVLFCDLVGSTSLANNLELEELRDVIRGFQAACAAVVRQFGGTISRYMGDGILVLFGYPHAHEDDAERAVRAGLSMVQAVARLRPPAAAAGPLAARVGIATGLVVAGDLIGDGSAEEEAILGETPNLAGRLHASAPPGGVVIASSTHALLGGRFLCENLGSQTIKGFGAPIRVWQVIAPRSISSHFKAADAAQLTPIVGREADLAWLHDRWQSATRQRGCATMLVGEAGIGKSRVAEALRDRLGDGCVPLRFQCSPHYVNRALHPIIQHIELAAGIGAEDPAESKLARLAAWMNPGAESRTLPMLAALLSIPAGVAPPLPPMSAQRAKQDTFELLLRLLRMQAVDRPLLIIFEDLHWADPTTGEFLAALVRRIEGLAALAIFTCRPHVVPTLEGCPDRAAGTCTGCRGSRRSASWITSRGRAGCRGRCWSSLSRAPTAFRSSSRN